MNLQISRITQSCPAWNKRSLNTVDLYKLAKKLKAKVHVIPLQVKGFYMHCLNQDHVYVDSKLSETEFLHVAFHELGHVLFHVPRDVCAAHFFQMRDTREEHEADTFAAVAMIPLYWLKTRTDAEMLDDGIPPDLIPLRKRIFELYKV